MNNKVFMYLSLWKEHGGAPGIGLFTFDTESGEITPVRQLNDSISFNCTYLDSAKGILYFLNEVPDLPDLALGGGGQVYAYKIDRKTGELTEFFRRPTFCTNPSYLNMDPEQKYLIIAHHSNGRWVTQVEKDAFGNFYPSVKYDDAAITLFEVNEDGSLGKMADVIKHSPVRELRSVRDLPRPHTAVRSPDGRLFAVCDKGTAHIYMYAIDKENGKLKLTCHPFADTPDSSPRYCVFHPTLPYFFVNHEKALNGQLPVSAFRYEENGKLTHINTVNALPEDYVIPEKTVCEQQGFVITEDGKYIYSVLNGPNMIAAFRVDEKTGEIELIQRQTMEAVWPRGIAIAPGEKFLVVSSLGGQIESFSIGNDGTLASTGSRANMQGGSYITFFDPNN